MNISTRLRSTLWIGPALICVPFLMGADGQGCGGEIAAKDGGSVTPPVTDASHECAPSDCAGQAVPALARVCPDGTAVSASVCVEQDDGTCGWGFPACPAVDGGIDMCASQIALPCAPCPYGSSGVGVNAEGCPTCPICLPPPDAGVVCSCPELPVDPVCPGGTRQNEVAGTAPCYCPTLGACPGSDAGGCTTSADCPSDEQCGFVQNEGCSAKGECFPTAQVECLAYEAGCACDGTETNLACNGLPDGYALKPLKHTGACTAGQ